MLKVPVYNAEGKETGTFALPDSLFGIKVDPCLVQQAVVTQRANARTAIAHTKLRSEVRGGGRKPWRQKGTGRARHGSVRSPLWRGGGITFGPRSNRNFTKKMNTKARRKALLMTLSDKANEKKILVVDGLKFEKPQTKVLAALIKKLPVGKTSLIVIPKKDDHLQKSSRNLPNVHTIRADSLNIVDLLKHQSLVVLKPAVDVMVSTYKGSKKK